MSKPEVLFLAANPKGTNQLALMEEFAAIMKELQSTPGSDAILFHTVWAATIDDAMRALNRFKPALVHFSGHGNEQGIALIGDDGVAQLLSPQALAGLLTATDTSAKAVLLDACYTDAQAQVVSDTVGCAVGMRGVITDHAAREFCVAFYRALGHGRSIYNAFCQGRATLAAKQLDKRAEPHCLTRPDVDASALHLLPTEANTPSGKQHHSASESQHSRFAQPTSGRDTLHNSVSGGIKTGDNATITLGHK